MKIGTVEELLKRISSTELTEWQEFYKREPFGEEWKQAAYLCTLIANGLLKKKDGSQFKEEDFYPVKIIKKILPQSDEEIEAVFSGVLAMVEAQQKNKKKPKAKSKDAKPAKPTPVPVVKKKK